MSVQAKKRIGRPRGEQSENAARRRKQVVEAAIESIVERGMSATTLATVAKAAGLSQGVAVFYFKSKENLLLETLRYHYDDYASVWKSALARSGPDPVARLTALVLADLDPAICTPANLTLWNSFWGEAGARPAYRELCDLYDGERYDAVVALCENASDRIAGSVWTPQSVADALDAMTDGMWIRMHITPGYMSPNDGRGLLVRFLKTVFPDDEDKIEEAARHAG